MRIGLLSDIHGDVKRLDTVLGKLAELKVEKIICAGDILDEYRYCADVIRMLTESKVVSILGNHDQEFLELVAERECANCYHGIEYLASLPSRLHLTLNRKKILITHSAPWDRNDVGQYTYVFPHQDEAVKRMSNVDADILVTGHSHVPFVKYLADTLIINPGSVSPGRGWSGSSTYAVLDTSYWQVTVFSLAKECLYCHSPLCQDNE